jgi:hypothetical protein
MPTLFAAALALALTQDGGSVLERFVPSIAIEERTEVLVLGTPHLETVACFEAPMLDQLLDVLESWGPDAICVEALPGRTIATMLSEEQTFAPVLARFVGGALEQGRAAQEYLGASALEAEATLREEGEQLGVFERAIFALAAWNNPTAMLHWSSLRDAGEEVPDDVPSGIVRHLDGAMASRNEITTLAVRLGLRLKLTRIDPVDDHLDKDDFLRISDVLTRELAASDEAKAVAAAAVYADSQANLASAVQAGNLLTHYVHLDDPRYGTEDVRAQWDLFLRTRLPSGFDRARLALWDVRNLAIIANVRRVTARVPGGRVLVVIGAGHKPFLDALLGTCMDVRTVRLADILGEEPK